MKSPPNIGYATLLLRLGLGSIFIAHGLAKALVFTLQGTADFFESVGLDGAWAVPVFALEVTCGLLLAVGMWSRWAALALVPAMVVASKVHFPNGWMFTNPNGGWEFTAFLTLALIAYFLLGNDGRVALSTLLRRRGPSA